MMLFIINKHLQECLEISHQLSHLRIKKLRQSLIVNNKYTIYFKINSKPENIQNFQWMFE